MMIRNIVLGIIIAPLVVVVTIAVLFVLAIELIYGIILLPFLVTYYITNKRRYNGIWN